MSPKSEKKVGYHFAFLAQTDILGPRVQKWIWNWTLLCSLPWKLWGPMSQNMGWIQKCKIEPGHKNRKRKCVTILYFWLRPIFGDPGFKNGPKNGCWRLPRVCGSTIFGSWAKNVKYKLTLFFYFSASPHFIFLAQMHIFAPRSQNCSHECPWAMSHGTHFGTLRDEIWVWAKNVK